MIKNLIKNIFGSKETPKKSLNLVRAEQIAEDIMSNNYIFKSENGFVVNHKAFVENFDELTKLTSALDYRIDQLGPNTPSELQNIQTAYSNKLNELYGYSSMKLN